MRGRKMALADAGALGDPFIRGVDPFRHFGVGDDSFRQVGPNPGQHRAAA